MERRPGRDARPVVPRDRPAVHGGPPAGRSEGDLPDRAGRRRLSRCGGLGRSARRGLHPALARPGHHDRTGPTRLYRDRPGRWPPRPAPPDPVGALGVLLGHISGAASFQGPLLTEAMTGGKAAYDGRFYWIRSPLSVVDRIRVPTFIVGGEYDLFQRGEPLLFDALQDR